MFFTYRIFKKLFVVEIMYIVSIIDKINYKKIKLHESFWFGLKVRELIGRQKGATFLADLSCIYLRLTISC